MINSQRWPDIQKVLHSLVWDHRSYRISHPVQSLQFKKLVKVYADLCSQKTLRNIESTNS